VRKAASMLELVIAIVVMGIAMMTLPLMLSRVQSNNNFAMQQEAILMARTQIGDIVTYRWDENSLLNFKIGVLDTNSTYFRRDGNSTRRVGHVKGNKRRKFFNSERNASLTNTFGTADNGESIPDDIDDFNDKDKNLTGTTNASFDYKFSDANTTMKISVKYINDSNTSPFIFYPSTLPTGTTTTNIKMITVDLNNSQLDGNLTLRAFSCNIGANQLLRKDFY